MKFKATLLLSIGLHLSLAALFIIQPPQKSNSMTYYVDLINLGSGGNGGSGGSGGGGSGASGGKGNSLLPAQQEAAPQAALIEGKSGSVKNLTVEKKFQSPLRYPDREGRKNTEPEKMISVIRKDRPVVKGETLVRGTTIESGLKTGISSGGGGGGGGSGNGDGSGGGYGPGSDGIGGYFPYAYYVDLLRSRISSSWYSSLVAPGLKGKYVAGVYFIVRRDGEVSDLRLENSSGIDSLDLSARRAIENAAPFAPLPPDFPSQYLVVHFEFEWEK